MKDRIPTPGLEGRLLITPEDGSPAFYAKAAMADNPTEQGTPFAKATMLTDETAALFGLGTDAVPDDAFLRLARFQSGLGDEYLWAKEPNPVENGTYTDRILVTRSTSNTRAFDIECSDKVTVSDGVVTLANPQTVSVAYNSFSSAIALSGKFVKSSVDSIIYKADPFNADEMKAEVDSQSRYCVYIGGGYEQTVKSVIEDTAYVNSPDPNAYPPAVDDGYCYTALGKFGEKTKIATGSYVGTGKSGADNPNSLTFDFVPKLLFVGGTAIAIIVPQNTTGMVVTTSGNYSNSGITVELTGKTVSWYGDSVSDQMNSSTATYNYTAIG